MKRHRAAAPFLILGFLALSMSAHAGFLDDMAKSLGYSATIGSGLDNPTIVMGLKEALATGTTRAVKTVAQHDGYFGNGMIKILLPEKVRTAANLLGRFGYQAEVDQFVLSMNRAAERAAPKATEYFVSALKEMTFEDARMILQGKDNAATEYFRQKTGDRIFSAFKPIVATSMQDVGVARAYTQMAGKIEALPFGEATIGSLDLDNYVTAKAVDGLFIMLGEEERKIRTDPAARGTELLRKVFGKQDGLH